VTASLPPDVQAVFDRFITTEYTTIDRSGQPITWPVTPYYSLGDPCISVTTGLGYPKKANDARANPLVALLFSDPTGSGLTDAPMILVQGSAEVDDRDLDANRERYVREAGAKLPAVQKVVPPTVIQKRMLWYFARLYINVRPERVYVWRRGDLSSEPELYDAHMEEVRSGHSEERARFHAAPEGGATAWNDQIELLGIDYPTAVLSITSPDGFPFAIRVPVRVDRTARVIELDAEPASVPLQPGLACLTAHRHPPDFTWQRNFQVRGDLQLSGERWVLVPHKLVGGFELPESKLESVRINFAKARRYHRVAKRELARRQ
jgi:hypothetical protein